MVRAMFKVIAKWLGRARNTEGLISFADYAWQAIRWVIGLGGGVVIARLFSQLEWFWNSFGWAGAVSVGLVAWLIITTGLYLMTRRAVLRGLPVAAPVENAPDNPVIQAPTGASIFQPAGTAHEAPAFKTEAPQEIARKLQTIDQGLDVIDAFTGCYNTLGEVYIPMANAPVESSDMIRQAFSEAREMQSSLQSQIARFRTENRRFARLSETFDGTAEFPQSCNR